MSTTVVRSARYMKRFGCLGGACEDNCCTGWTVPVDEPTHRRLTLLAESDPAARQRLTEGIELTPRGPNFARLRLRESGSCSMLDNAGLCSIHAQLGPAALSDVCSTYPRYFNEVDGELELFGTVSCPELARLCLLPSDGLELESLDIPEPPRKLRNQFTTQAPYSEPFLLVRKALHGLLAEPSRSLDEKLFVALWAANNLRGVLHAGCGPVVKPELSLALAALGEPELLRALAETFHALELNGTHAISVLLQAFRPGVGPKLGPGQPRDRFNESWQELWTLHRLDAAAELGELQLQAAWARHCALRAQVPRAAGLRVDVCLSRYAVNHLYTTPYMLSNDLLSYAGELALRVAALRLLLQAQLVGFEGSAEDVDRRIVDVVYAFARRVEHSDLLVRLASQLESQGLNTFAHALSFLAL